MQQSRTNKGGSTGEARGPPCFEIPAPSLPVLHYHGLGPCLVGLWPMPCGPLAHALWACCPCPVGLLPMLSGPVAHAQWACHPCPASLWPMPCEYEQMAQALISITGGTNMPSDEQTRPEAQRKPGAPRASQSQPQASPGLQYCGPGPLCGLYVWAWPTH